MMQVWKPPARTGGHIVCCFRSFADIHVAYSPAVRRHNALPSQVAATVTGIAIGVTVRVTVAIGISVAVIAAIIPNTETCQSVTPPPITAPASAVEATASEAVAATASESAAGRSASRRTQANNGHGNQSQNRFTQLDLSRFVSSHPDHSTNRKAERFITYASARRDPLSPFVHHSARPIASVRLETAGVAQRY
jgi:hypothetical protein